VGVTAAALQLSDLLRPARRADGGADDLAKAWRRGRAPEQSLANAALMGDKRLLFATTRTRL
jgi:hypothetical protein